MRKPIQTTFTLAQALRTLQDAGAEKPQAETAGLAFASHLLGLGYDADTLADAMLKGREAAGPDEEPDALYTLDASLEKSPNAVESFRQVTMETIRPGFARRLEADGVSRQKIAEARKVPPAFVPYLIFRKRRPEVEDDYQLARDLHDAAEAARAAVKNQNATMAREKT